MTNRMLMNSFSLMLKRNSARCNFRSPYNLANFTQYHLPAVPNKRTEPGNRTCCVQRTVSVLVFRLVILMEVWEFPRTSRPRPFMFSNSIITFLVFFFRSDEALWTSLPIISQSLTLSLKFLFCLPYIFQKNGHRTFLNYKIFLC